MGSSRSFVPYKLPFFKISFRGSISSSHNVVQDNFRDELLDRNASVALVIHPRNGQNDKELTVNKGEYLELPHWNLLRPSHSKALVGDSC